MPNDKENIKYLDYSYIADENAKWKSVSGNYLIVPFKN